MVRSSDDNFEPGFYIKHTMGDCEQYLLTSRVIENKNEFLNSRFLIMALFIMHWTIANI